MNRVFENRHRIISFWLFSVALMVFVMVVLGGLTRLTGSGLSMVDWRPVTGWLPPVSDLQWQAVFDLYKQSPQYHHINFDMTLDGFKGIFWLEYFHRLWGRLIGLCYALPLVFFFIRGWLTRKMMLPLIGLFVLGGLQGVLGWYMVQSGLVNEPEVSQYRLTAHLGFAFLLYAALIWAALIVLHSGENEDKGRPVRLVQVLWGLAFITILAGALVAGLDAGLTYNTFPLMDGELVPSGLFAKSPWWLNHFENITTVQFQHRALAVLSLTIGLYFFIQYRSHRSVQIYALVLILQVAIGIATLLHAVPIALASLHQAGGLLVFTTLTYLNFTLRR